MAADDEKPIDPAVVATLYVEHAEQLRLFLVGLLKDHQTAADVLQATFVKLTEKGGQTNEESRKSWLFRVAYHEAMAIRRREQVGDKARREVAWISEAATVGADQTLIRKETIEAVRKALMALPPEQQEIVRMRIYEEKKFVSIAEELNIPLGTALGRMRNALAKLRAGLEEEQR